MFLAAVPVFVLEHSNCRFLNIFGLRNVCFGDSRIFELLKTAVYE